MKVFVEGSPLSLKREALGLDMSGPEPLLGFGEVTKTMSTHTQIYTYASIEERAHATVKVYHHVFVFLEAGRSRSSYTSAKKQI